MFTSSQMQESNPGLLGGKRDCYLCAMRYLAGIMSGVASAGVQHPLQVGDENN